MPKVAGVHFRMAGKNHYYDPKQFILRIGDRVIAETSRGVEMGQITVPPMNVSEKHITEPLQPIIRVATERDLRIDKENREREKEAYRVGLEKIAYRGLDMKLIQTEYMFDRHKLLFYFTADGRVDFRDLVKDLAAIFRTRIELRQVGVRDETKILGGIGICGREVCCHTFLSDFAPVSIKMAKEQNLSLNPTKISGVCGRLMCCLTNEEETYTYLNKKMPTRGDGAKTKSGEEGVVTSINVLRQKVTVLFEANDTKELRECDVDDLTFFQRKRSYRGKDEIEEEEGAESETERQNTFVPSRKAELMKAVAEQKAEMSSNVTIAGEWAGRTAEEEKALRNTKDSRGSRSRKPSVSRSKPYESRNSEEKRDYKRKRNFQSKDHDDFDRDKDRDRDRDRDRDKDKKNQSRHSSNTKKDNQGSRHQKGYHRKQNVKNPEDFESMENIESREKMGGKRKSKNSQRFQKRKRGGYSNNYASSRKNEASEDKK